jgi:hypothetical protein
MTYQSDFADSDQPRQREAYRGVGTVKVESRAKNLLIGARRSRRPSGVIPDTPIYSVSHID